MKRQFLLDQHWIPRCQNVHVEMGKKSIFLPQSRDQSLNLERLVQSFRSNPRLWHRCSWTSKRVWKMGRNWSNDQAVTSSLTQGYSLRLSESISCWRFSLPLTLAFCFLTVSQPFSRTHCLSSECVSKSLQI